MKPIKQDENAGVYGIIIFTMVLGIAAFLWLTFNTFLEFFINYMPESATKEFFIMLWVHGGILIIVLFGAIFSLLMYMQKSKYPMGG